MACVCHHSWSFAYEEVPNLSQVGKTTKRGSLLAIMIKPYDKLWIITYDRPLWWWKDEVWIEKFESGRRASDLQRFRCHSAITNHRLLIDDYNLWFARKIWPSNLKALCVHPRNSLESSVNRPTSIHRVPGHFLSCWKGARFVQIRKILSGSDVQKTVCRRVQKNADRSPQLLQWSPRVLHWSSQVRSDLRSDPPDSFALPSCALPRCSDDAFVRLFNYSFHSPLTVSSCLLLASPSCSWLFNCFN